MPRPSPVPRRQKLIEARERAGLKSTELAFEIGIRRDTLCMIEGGYRHPSFALMVRWAQALGRGLEIWDLEAPDENDALPYAEWFS